MAISRIRNQGGFTLIELVIIIVVLGILAAVAIPKYQDISSEAKEAAARAALGSIRSGITIFYANQAVSTGTAIWPTLTQLATYGTVMAQGLPRNPYQGETRGVLVAGGRGGWCYLASTGEIWPNTNTAGEKDW
jgi:prepilin-type N-terminal cleavage/methylation domain-containing protein